MSAILNEKQDVEDFLDVMRTWGFDVHMNYSNNDVTEEYTIIATYDKTKHAGDSFCI